MKRTHLLSSVLVTAIGALLPTLLAPGCVSQAELDAKFRGPCPNPILDRHVLDDTTIDPCCCYVPCPGHLPWRAADGTNIKPPPGCGYCLDDGTGSNVPSSSTGSSSTGTSGTGGSGTGSSSSSSSTGTGGSKGAACDGICAPKPPPGWSRPFLLWTGAPGSAPPCPASAPHTILMNGYADLVAPPATCSACTCSTPSGTCGAPDNVAVSSGACPYDPATDTRTPLHIPTAGSEACTPTTKLPPTASCNGKPCAHSVTVGPLPLNEGACAPNKLTQNDVPPAVWSLEAQGCASDEAPCDACSAPGTTCVPPQEERDGRALCAFTFGDEACFTPWEDKRLFYRSVVDSRSCSPCGCGAATGSRCEGRLTLFQDGACKAPLVTTAMTSAEQPACRTFDKASPAIGSMKLSTASYIPGACPATGGAPVGIAKGAAPVTVCCALM
jgi:hypothetical protein